MNARILGSVLLVLALLIGGWYGYQYWQTPRYRAPVAPPPIAAPAVPVPAEPRIQHPLPESAMLSEAELTPEALRQELYRLANRNVLESIFYMDDFARRAVATADNLPRENVAMQVRVAKEVPGRFRVSGKGDELVLDAQNFARYTPMVTLFESLDPERATALFIRFYPMFQREYRTLGYPDRYLNDQLVAAIDDMLTAPEPQGPVRLVQPQVLYRFADPQLESLSAGQKLMIRMGPENAARVKRQLRNIRRELTAAPVTAASAVR
jgi:hypothetical protein